MPSKPFSVLTKNKSKEFHKLVAIENGTLVLGEAVARLGPSGQKDWVKGFARKIGWSEQKLHCFFREPDIRQAAEILHELGYRIAEIKVERKKTQRRAIKRRSSDIRYWR